MEKEPERILIVDDDSSMRMALGDSLRCCGYDVALAENGEEALQRFRKEAFAVVVTDIRMPKLSGMEVLRGIKKVSPATPVILITAYGTVSTAVEAMKEGAAEFITKPFSLDDLEFVVRNVLASAGRDGDSGPSVFHDEIVTKDARMSALLSMLASVAKSRSCVLLQGESGTGKELFARHIYRHSTRSDKPFVAVNCAAIPHNLLESEMFGYEKGAFTGAAQRKLGKFELAHGGTLLLDEISEMDVQLQAKLLRVIQESEVDRLGGRAPVAVDVRIIATTNTDLRAAIEDKKFREDLYYRLNVIPVRVPPLRERVDDILLLAEHFLHKYSVVSEKTMPQLSPEAATLLLAHSWPGNVRELEHVIERAVLVCAGEAIQPADLGLERGREVESAGKTRETACATGMPTQTLRDMEKSLIFETLHKVNGNRTKASKLLGISVRTMRNKLHEYQFDEPTFLNS
jgi:DNA-binding NtrC family response regulator